MQIEDNIPPPEPSHRGVMYPFRRMKVGQSVFFADEPKGTASKPAIAARVAQCDSKKELMFTARKIAGGVRIWRIA